MESSSSSSRCRQSVHSYRNHKLFLLTHLQPAIEDKSCTICLNQIEEAAVITVCLHAYCSDFIRKWSNRKRRCPLCNAQFASLFVGIDLSSMTFRTQHLSPLKESSTKVESNIRYFYGRRRAIGISRELNVVNRRTRPLPKQRSFGQSNMLPPGVSKERILQWRASICEQNLLAVPCPTRKSLEQDSNLRPPLWEVLGLPLHQIANGTSCCSWGSKSSHTYSFGDITLYLKP